MILADKIIDLRKKNGWSQEELAEKLNVSRQSVSKWEGAQSVPDLDKILKLSEIFEVSTDYLLKDEIDGCDNGYGRDCEEYNASDSQPVPVRKVTMEEANDFLAVKEYTSRLIALCTALCILSPICLILLPVLAEVYKFMPEEQAVGAGLIILIMMIVPAVAMFIYCGSKTSPYEYLETEVFETEYGVTGMVMDRQNRYKDTYTRSNIIGTCLCIMSTLPLFSAAIVMESDILAVAGVCMLLIIVAIGVYFFISAGIKWASFQKLLQEGDYSREAKLNDKDFRPFSSVYWLAITAVYLGYSFITGKWYISWVIWPVAAVLFAAIKIIFVMVKNRK